MAIRYDKKLNEEINRTIRNFNQKIARLERTNRNLILPSRITKKELKTNVETRKELKRKLNELKRYSTKGIEKTITTNTGLKTSLYELENLRRESIRLKRNITREIKTLQVLKPTIFGKEQVATFAQMGDEYYLNLEARRKALNKNLFTLNREEYERYKKLLDKTGKGKERKDLDFKQNYLDMLTKLGYYYGYDEQKLTVLKDRLISLNTRDFIKVFNTDKAVQNILYYYPIITGKINGMNPSDIEEDVSNLYDNLISNINYIIK